MASLLDNFYVVAVISNPVRYKRRYDLYQKFENEMLLQGIKIITVEVAFGERDYEVTKKDNDWHIQLRTKHELWHKENMINLAVSRLPTDWKYLAWIDADISFQRYDWAEETVHALQHHPVVQLFQNAVDMGPNGEVLPDGLKTSFGYCVAKGLSIGVDWRKYSVYPHPGFAWAMTRDCFEACGGLLDKMVVGSGDHHMAWGFVGKAKDTFPKDATDAYTKMVITWGDRAFKYVKGNVGYVPGTIFHHYHGKKVDRQYNSRWKILLDSQFDPHVDIFRDSQGLYQLNQDKPVLAQEIRTMFRNRNEDSTDV